jgi:hypothetical protein
MKKRFLIDIVHHKLVPTFSESSDLQIGSDIEILGSLYFSSYKSFSSISFESNSQLIPMESETFHGLDVMVIIPSTIVFIGSDAMPNVSQISITDGDSCLEFGREWQFKRIWHCS